MRRAVMVALSVLLFVPVAATAQQVTPSLDFATVTVGQSAVQPVTISNPGGTQVTIDSVAFGPDTPAGYVIAGAPATPFDLAPGGSATVNVRFEPQRAGQATGTLQVVSGTSAVAASLTGIGRFTGLTLSAPALDFGTVAAGNSGALPLTITNPGPGALVVNRIAVGTLTGPEFTLVTGPVPISVAPGTSTVVTVQYAPSAVGVDRGTLELALNLGSARIPLTGTATDAEMAVVPSAVSFGNLSVGDTETVSVSIQNPSTLTLTIDSLSLAAGSSPALTLVNPPTTPFSLAPGTAQTVDVRFAPTLVGTDEGVLRIQANGGPLPSGMIPITGNGVQSAFRLEPTDIDFGYLSPGAAATATMQIQNSGSAPLSVTGLGLAAGSSTAFSLVTPPATPFTVPAGAAQAVQVRYGAGAAAVDTGTVEVATGAGAGSVALTGASRMRLEARYFTSVPFRLGSGLECWGCIQIRLLDGVVAPAGGLQVTVVSDEPSILLVAPSSVPASGGAPSVVVTIPQGADSTSVSVQGMDGETGTTTVTATAPGAQSATSMPIQVEMPGYSIVGLGASHSGGGADAPFTVRVGLLPNPSVNYQRVRQGGLGLNAVITSSNAAAGQLVTTGGASGSVTIPVPFGQFETRTTVALGGVAFRPLGAGGSTTVTASIAGLTAVAGASQAVTVVPAAPTLLVSLGATTRIGADLQVASCCTVTVNQAAPAGGLDVTLTSSDAARLRVAPPAIPSGGGTASVVVNIPAGGTTASFSLQGIAAGTATVTATGSGYASGTSGTVTVEAPVLTLTGLTATQTVAGANDEFQVRIGIASTPGGTTFGTAQALRRGGPASVTATVTTSNTTPGTLVTTGGSGASRTVTIAAEASESGATVAAGGIAFDPAAVGTTTVSATIPGFTATTTASQSVTVSSSNAFRLELIGPRDRIGIGLQCSGCYQLRLASGALAPAGGMVVTMTSSDPSRLVVGAYPMPITGGTGSVDVTIPAGLNVVAVGVQAPETATPGTATVTVTAAGADPGTKVFTVEQGVFTLIGLASPQTAGQPDQRFQVRVGLLNASGDLDYQRVRFGSPGLPITVTSSNPTAGQIVSLGAAGASATVIIDDYAFETYLDVTGFAFRPLAGGNTTVTISMPNFGPANGATQTVQVIGPTPTLTVSTGAVARLGAGLEVGACCSVSLNLPAPAGGLPVTLTSSDASRLLIAPATIPAGGGSGSLVVTVPAGATSAQFSLQGGTATGDATVTATATGWTAGTSGTVSVETPLVTLLNLAPAIPASSSDDPFQARIGLAATAGSTTFGIPQALRRGAGDVTATVTTSNAAAGTLVTSSGSGVTRTVVISQGQSESAATVAAGGVAFNPNDTADTDTTTIVSVSIPGFTASSTASQSVVLATPPPSISVTVDAALRLGAGLEIGACCSVTLSAPAPAGGLAVTLTSSDASRLLLAAATPVDGSGTLIVNIPAGATTAAFSLQGGSTPGTATVTASAAGHTPGTSAPIAIETPLITLVNLAAAQQTTGSNDEFQVRVGLATTPGSSTFGAAQVVRQGSAGLTATVTTSNAAAGTLVTDTGSSSSSRTVQIAAGQSDSPATLAALGIAFDPDDAGTAGTATTIAASIPGLAASSTASQVVTLAVSAGLALDIRYFVPPPFRVGSGLEFPSGLQVRLLNNAVAPPGGLAVTVTSNDPGILLVAPASIPAGGGTASTVLTIAAGTNATTLSLQGREAVTGTTTLTATAPGATSATSQPIQVETPGYMLFGLVPTYLGGDPDRVFSVRVGLITDGALATQRVRIGGPGLSVTVQTSNPAAGQIVTNQGVFASTTVAIPGGRFDTLTSVASGGLAFRPLSAGGTTTLTAAIALLQATPQSAQTVTVSPATPRLTVNTAARIGANLEVASCCTVSLNVAAPAGGLDVTLTSSDAARLLVAPATIPAGGGSTSIVVNIPAGGMNASFSLQGIAAGSATVTATASGYTTGVSPAVSVETPLVTLANLAGTASPTGADDDFTVRIGIASAPGGSTFGTAQALRRGAAALTATVTSSTSAAGTLVTSGGSGDSRTVSIAVGQSESPATVAAGGIAFNPNDSATGSESTTIAVTIPGFTASTTASQAVALSGLRMEFFFHHPGSTVARLGAGLQIAGGVAVRLLDGAVAPPGGLTITVTSDFAGLLVGNTGFPVTGLPSRQFTIPEGATLVSISVQGVENTLGIGRLTVTAPGAQPAVSEPIHIVQPIVTIQELPANLSASAADTFFLLMVGVPLDNGLVNRQQTRQCTCLPEHPYTATISSSNGAVAQLVMAANAVEVQRAAVVTGQWQQGHTFTEPGLFPIDHIAVAIDPLAAGTTQISVSMTGFITSTLEGTRTITITP